MGTSFVHTASEGNHSPVRKPLLWYLVRKERSEGKCK